MNNVIKYLLLLLVININSVELSAQGKKEKYQGLLWEISGNGLKKPSYVFGSMHVSAKLAFNLSDSFYNCIKNVDVVALESNPEQLQEDFSNSKMLKITAMGVDVSNPNSTKRGAFTINNYKDILKAGLVYQPQMINHLLYRSYASKEDFEEDTFLDMYIYQVGKKLGKRATGVENFFESEQLMLDAFKDDANERKKNKNREYASTTNVVNMEELMTDAYRKGDLDMLDSLQAKQSRSTAFLEKFLYKRNDNMFHSIDSIIKTSSLFAGVGAAHLPGDRGLIKLLRKAGYTVRPIKMTNQLSNEKERLEKVNVPVHYTDYNSEDGWISMRVPGKLFNFSSITVLNQLQYADLANGAYYLVSRVKTNALELGQNEQDVYKRVDSLLYENIAGKILSKQQITNNGYVGFDIKNKTRRGDLQRHQIFITPFEIILFKMSGTGDYLDSGAADEFFTSIKLKPLATGAWSTYTPFYKDYSISIPPSYLQGNYNSLRNMGKRIELSAVDKNTKNSFLLVTKTWETPNLDEDSVELSFAEEAFLESEFVKNVTKRSTFNYKGYPCLQVQTANHDHSTSITRFILKGNMMYMLSTRFTGNPQQANNYLNSFEFKKPQYGKVEKYVDTALYYTVQTSVQPNSLDEINELINTMYSPDEAPNNTIANGKSREFANDSTGEAVHVGFYRIGDYTSYKDSTAFWKQVLDDYSGYVIMRQQKSMKPYGEELVVHVRDTNSLRNIMAKVIIRQGTQYYLTSVYDSLSGPSEFVQTFFNTFTPKDTLIGKPLYASKSAQFFEDFYATDSTTKARARAYVGNFVFRDEDAPQIIKMVQGMTSSEKNYLDVKTNLMYGLKSIKHPAILPFLEKQYIDANDTTRFQYAVLSTLIAQQTKESFDITKRSMLKETPIFSNLGTFAYLTDDMSDSLQLAKTLFPEMLQLTTMNDYKVPIYTLLAEMVDSNIVSTASYQDDVNQIAFDARIAVLKAAARELNNQSNEEDDQDDEDDAPVSASKSKEEADEELSTYATLLFPYKNTNKNAARFFEKYEQIKNPAQQISLAALYLKNKQTFPDSTLQKIADQPLYRMELYRALKGIGRVDKMPAKYTKQDEIALAILYANIRSYDNIDTIVYLGKQQTTYKFKPAIVYFYKYKKNKLDATWYLATSGIQPVNTKEINDNEQLTNFTNTMLDEKKPLGEQFYKALRKVKYRYRYIDNDNVFYSSVE
ncbi:uncharacterized protein YbaP (TraB family) [Chitinophaga skermanii]|uniref:Uncharacterized protein YbaP (TraB family) n=1 Tax=Chitinophaga skermanii TaxID=331697 RepID=A0A327QCW1_9BACT|nr:TraB/GumN family protein [Chitinophaga skermanii]RAJ02476.1 uncharacterized protein YbaP (TraB family) [Chitinophaga skermanii]